MCRRIFQVASRLAMHGPPPEQGGYVMLTINESNNMNRRYFVIRKSKTLERVHVIAAGENVIGRHSGCDIQLADLHVSRKHAVVLTSEKGCSIRDLGSRNGTRVDGNLIRADTELVRGTAVEIPPFALTVCIGMSDVIANTEGCDDSTQSGRFRVNESRGAGSTASHLTPAQRRVYDLFLEGLTEKEVAVRLGLSIHTVHGHAKELYRSLSVSTRGELIAQSKSFRGDS